MENGQIRNTKVKLVAWCVLIAAVVIIYVAMTARAHGNTATIATATGTTATKTQSSTTTTPAANSGSSSTAAVYKDGSYSANSTYRTPHSTESIAITITVSGGTVTDATVQQQPNNHDSAEYQAMFQDSYKPYVVGKKLSDISLSRVSGSSLTSEGFNSALDQIKTQAQTQG